MELSVHCALFFSSGHVCDYLAPASHGACEDSTGKLL